MATGSGGLSPREQERVESAVLTCRREYALDLSVLIGDLSCPDDAVSFRAAAEQVHAGLGERSPAAVLLLVAPGQRRVEVVTGPQARRRVPDRVASLAVISMTTAFGGGDLVGGVVDGIRQLSDAAGRRPGVVLDEVPRGPLGRRELTAGAEQGQPALH